MRKNLTLVTILIGLIGLFACGGISKEPTITVTTFSNSPTVGIEDEQKFNAFIKNGHYDYVNSAITAEACQAKFSSLGPTTLELVHFDKWLTSEEVLQRLDVIGFKPAGIEDLLAFGAQHTDEQRKYPIVALGSSCVVNGIRHMPVLYGSSTRRDLHLDWFDSRWGADCRFLVVRK